MFTEADYNKLVEEVNEIYLKCEEEFGSVELDEALKEHYADVCCDGDVIMHKFINQLNEKGKIFGKSQEKSSHREIGYVMAVLKNLQGTLEEWFEEKEMKPDTWWADTAVQQHFQEEQDKECNGGG